MKEISFFETDNVIVTQTRFIVSYNVYEIKNISSVKIGIIKTNRALKFTLMMIGCLLLFFKTGRILGIVLFSATFLSLYFIGEKYAVRIDSGTGEKDSLISNDKDHIEKVVNAINSAMWTYHSNAAPM